MPTLKGLIFSLNANHRIRFILISFIKKIGLYNLAKATLIRFSNRGVRVRPPIEIRHLSPRARSVYGKLKAATRQNEESC